MSPRGIAIVIALFAALPAAAAELSARQLDFRILDFNSALRASRPEAPIAARVSALARKRVNEPALGKLRYKIVLDRYEQYERPVFRNVLVAD